MPEYKQIILEWYMKRNLFQRQVFYVFDNIHTYIKKQSASIYANSNTHPICRRYDSRSSRTCEISRREFPISRQFAYLCFFMSLLICWFDTECTLRFSMSDTDYNNFNSATCPIQLNFYCCWFQPFFSV